MTEQNNKNKKNKKQTVIIIILALILVGCIVTISVLLLKPKEEDQKPQPAKGVVGVVKDGWEDELSDDGTSDESRKGTVIPGYKSSTMKEGDMSLKLRIGNPKENTVGFYATLRLSDGTELYHSPLLKPGQGLEEIPLDQTLKKGTYDAVVEYRCVLLDEDETPLNSAESGLIIYVE